MLTRSRLGVFREVVMGASSVSEIARAMGISERAVYTHLSALRSHGLVVTGREISPSPLHHARMLTSLVMRDMRWGGSASRAKR